MNFVTTASGSFNPVVDRMCAVLTQSAAVVLVPILLASLVSSATAATVEVGPCPDDPTWTCSLSISDLAVGEKKYDVDFVPGTFSEVYPDPTIEPFWQDQTGAVAAAMSMAGLFAQFNPEVTASRVGSIGVANTNTTIFPFGFNTGSLYYVYAATSHNSFFNTDYASHFYGVFSKFTPITDPMALALSDTDWDGIGDLAVIRPRPLRMEVRGGNHGTLLENIPLSDAGVTFIDVNEARDTDNDGVNEVAALLVRRSDGRSFVELREVAGGSEVHQIWLSQGNNPVAFAMINEDADSNGVPEIAVLSKRNSDGRGVVEIKNASGPTNPHTVWLGTGLEPLKITTVSDADRNGVPEVAVLSRRASDGRIAVEIKNAAGTTNTNTIWFMAGNTAIDLAVVADRDGNGVPEIAVLSKRDSDGRMVVEVKNAAGPTNPSAVWFAAGHTGLALEALGDSDGNSVPELAVLSRRDSDGRILVEVKNVTGATNPRSLWYPHGFAAHDLAILDDVDGNNIEEAAVLMIRESDGRILVESRNTAGPQSPKDYWFSP